MQAEADLVLDIFGLVNVTGTFGFKKASDTFYKTDATAHTTTDFTADYLAIGGSVSSAFIGVGSLGERKSVV